MSNAYRTTTVPIARSQEAIRKLLIDFGVRGVQFSEDFETRQIIVRFAKEINGQVHTVNVGNWAKIGEFRWVHSYYLDQAGKS